MADEKATSATVTTAKPAEVATYPRAWARSKKYAQYAEIINILLDPATTYTEAQEHAAIQGFMKGAFN